MKIGDVAREVGISPSALRFYERAGLLPAPERVGGRRVYDEAVLLRLRVIQLGKRAGFSLDEIRMLLDGFDRGDAPSARWKHMAHTKLAELADVIERAEQMQAVLREGLACDCLRLDECALVDG